MKNALIGLGVALVVFVVGLPVAMMFTKGEPTPAGTSEAADVPASASPAQSTPSTPSPRPGQTPEEAYRAYCNAWGAATKFEDVFPYRGGPEFEEERAMVEGSPEMAAMMFAGFKTMYSEGIIESIDTLSEDANAASLKVRFEPQVDPAAGTTGTVEISVDMLNQDGRWLIASESIHASASMSAEVSFSTSSTASPAPAAAAPTGDPYKDLALSPVGPGSRFITRNMSGAPGEKEYAATGAVVVYYPEKRHLRVRLVGDPERGRTPTSEFTIRSFMGTPSIYKSGRYIYLVRQFANGYVECEERTFPAGEKLYPTMTAEEVSAKGEFRTYVVSNSVYVVQ